MISMNERLKEKVLSEIDSLRGRLWEISREIHSNPELGYREFKASELLASRLEREGFEVVRGVAGLPTAFKAVRRGSADRPRIGLMAEYDALPGVGHGCGHNIISAITLGAALALSKIMDRLPGTLVVFGTPAEEAYVDNAGGKVVMLGDIKEVDAAMMFHPSSRTTTICKSISREALEFEFKGKAVHAAGETWRGVNALEAAMLTFSGINALRQHLRPGVLVHGIIAEGGEAPNIIPDRAVIRLYVRAKDPKDLEEASKRVKNCARGAALATGAELRIRNYANTYINMITNMTLAEALERNLRRLGVEIDEPREGRGSTDMGNVSHNVPAVHAYIRICPEGTPGHSKEFAEAAISREAEEALVIGAKALAMTVIDLLTKPELMRGVREEFEETIKGERGG
jgi:amidohydrolase